MFYRASIVLGICLGLSAHSALADTLSGELGVSATIVARCILNSVSPMIFPPYSPLNPNPDRSSASIVVTCSRNIAYNLGLNRGRNPTATIKDRLFGGGLGRGGQKFVYTLLRRLNSKQYWGDLIGKDTLARLGTGLRSDSPFLVKLLQDNPLLPAIILIRSELRCFYNVGAGVK